MKLILAGYLAAALCCESLVFSQSVVGGAPVSSYIAIKAGKLALTHVLVLDGTGGPARADQTGKRPGVCPGQNQTVADIAKRVEVNSPEVKAMIGGLVAHHVAVTSTLDVLESFVPNRPPMELLGRVATVLSASSWSDFITTRVTIAQVVASGDVEDGLMIWFVASAMPKVVPSTVAPRSSNPKPTPASAETA